MIKLNESSLSRLYRVMQQYDVVCISSEQYLPDRRDFNSQYEFEKEFKDRLGKEKKHDHRALRLALSAFGYGIYQIKGFYQYNKESVPSKENSYCVVNRPNDPDFLDKCLQEAVKCKQNSIYYVPANSFEGSWIYTGVDLSEPGGIDKMHAYGDTEYRGPVHFGTYATSDDGTGYSLLNGRPFGSYTDGEVKSQIDKVKTKNTSGNITVIDESICDPATIRLTKEYVNNFKKFTWQ